MGLEATKISEINYISRNTINILLNRMKERIISSLIEQEFYFVTGEVQVDESYFGGRKVKGKRDRDGGSKIKVFTMKTRGDKVIFK